MLEYSFQIRFTYYKKHKMNIETLREYVFQKPLVEEGFSFGETVIVFKVKNTIIVNGCFRNIQLLTLVDNSYRLGKHNK